MWRFLAVSLLALGCEAERVERGDVDAAPVVTAIDAGPPVVRCDGAFVVEPGVDVGQAQSAADGWNAFVGRDLVRLTRDAQCRVRIGSLSNGDFASQSNGVITVDPARAPTDPTWMRHLLMHEMGHAFGLSHLDGERGVMAPSTELATPYFTAADRAECLRVHVCE